MYKPALLSGSIMAMLAVILGAFGAHYLKTIFTPELLSSFETGVRYQMYHAFALLIVGIIGQHNDSISVRTIFLLFLSGILLFSGSIYALCFLKTANIIGISGIGILTPLGGVCMIIGWGMFAASIFKMKERKGI